MPADRGGRGVGLGVQLEGARLVRADADHVASERTQPLDHRAHLRERRQQDVDLRGLHQVRRAGGRGPRTEERGGGRTSGSGHIGSLSRLVSSRLTISTRTSCAIRMGRPIRVAALISKLSTGTSPRLTSLRTRRYEHIVRGNKGRPLRRGGPSSDWVW